MGSGFRIYGLVVLPRVRWYTLSTCWGPCGNGPPRPNFSTTPSPSPLPACTPAALDTPTPALLGSPTPAAPATPPHPFISEGSSVPSLLHTWYAGTLRKFSTDAGPWGETWSETMTCDKTNTELEYGRNQHKCIAARRRDTSIITGVNAGACVMPGRRDTAPRRDASTCVTGVSNGAKRRGFT